MGLGITWSCGVSSYGNRLTEVWYASGKRGEKYLENQLS